MGATPTGTRSRPGRRAGGGTRPPRREDSTGTCRARLAGRVRPIIPAMAVGSSNSFDLVVLGEGTGGYTAAFRAAQLGLRVALVDEDKIGGTCLHRGCIPTKALLESASLVERIRHARDFGIEVGEAPAVDYAAVARRRDQVVKRMWTGLKTLVDKNKVAWVEGRGRLEGPQRVRVSLPGEDGTPGAGGERLLEASDVIMATGSRVKSLPGLVPDGRRIVTSDDVSGWRRCPRAWRSSARERSGSSSPR